MIEISVNNRKRLVPENWKEVSNHRKLFLFTLSLFFKGLTKQEILNAFAFKVLKISGIKKEQINKVLANNPDSDESESLAINIYRATELFKYVVDIQPNIKTNLFNVIFRFRKLFAPQNLLSQTGIWEFALAEKAFFDFSETQKNEHLDKLIAILYRKKKPFYFFRKFSNKFNGDKRIRFNEYTYSRNLKRISKLPFITKWVIYRWFAHQRADIIETFKYVFKKKETGDSESASWADTIIALAIVGDEEKASYTKLDLILTRINNEARAAAEMERKLKNQKQ